MPGFERYWQQHYSPHTPKSLDYPRIGVFEFFKKAADANPDRVALEFFGRATSYDELEIRVERFAAALWRLGVRPGKRIIFLLPNCPQFVIAYLAAMRLGAAAVMANPLNVERELIFKFNDSGAETLIALDVLSERVNRIKKEVPLKAIIYVSLADDMPWPLSWLFPIVSRKQFPKKQIEWDTRTHAFKELQKEMGPAPDWRETAPSTDDLAVLIYSGGTTGVSKGIMLSHFALVSNALQILAWGDLDETDSFLAVLPLFHGFGLSVGMNATLGGGGRLILLPKFDARMMLQTIHKRRPTFFAGVPTMYVALKELPDFDRYDISCLRGMFCGAAPLAGEVQREFEQKADAPIIEGYGLTEIVTAICCNPMSGTRKFGTVGIPFPDIDARIVDLEDGVTEKAPGEAGELILSGPNVMMGYLNRPKETDETLRDGWLYTGDICIRDEDGFISVVDRKKDLIIVSGFNVFPREIDEVLHEHPKVLDAVAVGLPHDKKGEYIKAYVVPKAGETITPEEIIAHCKQRLTPYMVPKDVEVRAELPKTMIGKVLRRALREEELEKRKKV
jgi:long-chain acyl-CoA synthetase